MTSTDEEILKEVLENWKGSNIYHKDVQAIAYQSISLSREDEQKKILDFLKEIDRDIRKDKEITADEKIQEKINQLSGKEMKERR